MTSPAPTTQETTTETTTPAPTPTHTTTPAPGPTFTPEQQAEIDRRAAAARKEGLEAGKRAAEDAVAAAKAKADEDAKVAAQVAAGEFDAAKATLEKRATDAEADRDGYKKRYEDAVAQVKPGVDAKWATLPAEVTRLYRGADDDPIAKASFLAESEDIVKALSGSTGNGTVRVPLTPRPTGKETPEVTSLVNTKNF